MVEIDQHEQAGRLPDFIIIGATKAGTTSLDFYLSLHPQIQMARPKEPRFFIDAPEPMGRWGKGIEWYRGLFQGSKGICGEASPSYTHFPALPGVPERMAKLVPNAKLIYLVREPMERMKSHFLMHCRQKGCSESLGDFLSSNPESRCLLASCYGSQFERFLEFFLLEQILLLEYEELARNRGNILPRHVEFYPAVRLESTLEVPAVTIDDWIKEQGSAIVVRVQGAEANLSPGMVSTQLKVRLIYTECTKYSDEGLFEGQLSLDQLMALLLGRNAEKRFQQDGLLKSLRGSRQRPTKPK